MANEPPDLIYDALRISQARRPAATALDTEGLRKLAAEIRQSAVFTARGTSKVFASEIKRVVDLITSDQIGKTEGVHLLRLCLKVLRYTPEGGFPDAPAGAVPPAVQGTLQDLSSYLRMKRIIETQMSLMDGSGQRYRGHLPENVEAFPGWELVRILPRVTHRDNWYSRWTISGGRIYPHDGSFEELYSDTGCICLKGDPVLQELGSTKYFPDGLDVDYSPFVWGSGIGLREVSVTRCRALNVVGPNGESIEQWQSKQSIDSAPVIPSPRFSTQGLDAAMAAALQKETGAIVVQGKPQLLQLPPARRMSTSERAQAALRRRAEARQKAGAK